jgi:hypothetical protein
MRHRWLPEARSYATRHAQTARIACVKNAVSQPNLRAYSQPLTGLASARIRSPVYALGGC